MRLFGHSHTRMRSGLYKVSIAAIALTGALGAYSHGQAHAASTASVTGSCNTWTDGTTFGVECTGLSASTMEYSAEANCLNGYTVNGNMELGTSGTWSYAYCSEVGSSISSSYIQITDAGSGPLARVRAPARVHPVNPVVAHTMVPAASENGHCTVWTDGVTFGAACTGMPSWYYYALGICGQGQVGTEVGNLENPGSGAWSYAYCSILGDNVVQAEVYFQ